MDYRINCKHCGKSALRGKSFAQWCSDECKWAARRARDKRPDEGPGLKLWANENPCITPDPGGCGGAFVVAHSAEDAAEVWNGCDKKRPHTPDTAAHDWREYTESLYDEGLKKDETPAEICKRNGRGYHCFCALPEEWNPVPEVGSVWLAMMRKEWKPRKVLSVVFAGGDAVITLGAADNGGVLNTCPTYHRTFWDKNKFKPADAEETEPEAKAEAEQEASAGGVAEELAALRAEVAALRADIAAAESRRSADSASVGALLGELAKAWK